MIVAAGFIFFLNQLKVFFYIFKVLWRQITQKFFSLLTSLEQSKCLLTKEKIYLNLKCHVKYISKFLYVSELKKILVFQANVLFLIFIRSCSNIIYFLRGSIHDLVNPGLIRLERNVARITLPNIRLYIFLCLCFSYIIVNMHRFLHENINILITCVCLLVTCTKS